MNFFLLQHAGKKDEIEDTSAATLLMAHVT
jgi:hypothetical protein